MPYNAIFAVVKLAQGSIYESEWQAGKGVGEGSGLCNEFLPLRLDPLQPDDARHAISLNFQSVKWEHFQEVMQLTSLMQVRVKVLFYFSLWPSSVLPTLPLCIAPSFRCRQ